MGSIVIELTNYCNLSCAHCPAGRHGADGHLGLPILRKVLDGAHELGFGHLAFTGGEPTIHPRFAEIVRETCARGYLFSFVSNGLTLPSIYEKILPYREKLHVITFSLDGATRETHDTIRGKGSFDRLMHAVMTCVAKELPFTFNAVVAAHNRHELEAFVRRARNLGSAGIRFIQLIPTENTTRRGLNVSLAERKNIEDQIRTLQESCDFPIGMAPAYDRNELFPCGPLNLTEFNIDWRGNVTKCCNLSSRDAAADGKDVVGNLAELTLAEAYQRLTVLNREFRAEKLKLFDAGKLRDTDYFPCRHCENRHGKADWQLSPV